MSKQDHFNQLLQNGKFAALAIDQGTSLKDIIKESKGATFTTKDYFLFKKQIILNLGIDASSVLFDYDTYLSDPCFRSIETSKIIAYEDDSYNIDNKSRITLLPKILNQNDEIIKDFSAIKFFMYFNPDSDPIINNEKFKVIKYAMLPDATTGPSARVLSFSIASSNDFSLPLCGTSVPRILPSGC